MAASDSGDWRKHEGHNFPALWILIQGLDHQLRLSSDWNRVQVIRGYLTDQPKPIGQIHQSIGIGHRAMVEASGGRLAYDGYGGYPAPGVKQYFLQGLLLAVEAPSLGFFWEIDLSAVGAAATYKSGAAIRGAGSPKAFL